MIAITLNNKQLRCSMHRSLHGIFHLRRSFWQQQRNTDTHYKFCNAAGKRNQSITQALDSGTIHIQQIQHPQKDSHNKQVLLYAISNTCRSDPVHRIQTGTNITSKQHHHGGNESRREHCHIKCRCARPFRILWYFFAPKIPAHIGCNGISIWNGSQSPKAIQLVRCRKSGYKQKTKSIDQLLYHKSSHWKWSHSVLQEESPVPKSRLSSWGAACKVLLFQADIRDFT